MRVNLFYNMCSIVFLLCTSCCFDFEQNYLGVSFRPYVKNKEGSSTPSRESYNRENIMTMLTLVSTKFAKVLVKGAAYSVEARYNENTYSNGSYVNVYSGEIAATINKANGNKSLTVWYQVDVQKNGVDTEILLVLEAIRKANRIFPGTVEGIIFGGASSLSKITEISNFLQSYKNSSLELNVKLGAQLLNCFDFVKETNATIMNAEKDVIVKSEIIACDLSTPAHSEIGPKDSFESIVQNILSVKSVLGNINPNVTAFVNVEWSSSGTNEWETTENLRIYWETASKFASEEKITIFLDEAFDNPYRWIEQKAHLGWWRLKDNSEINSIEGYVEKITEKDVESLSTWSKFLIVSLVGIGGLLLILMLFSLFGYLFFRAKRQPAVLRLSEIRAFHTGQIIKQTSSSHETALENALNCPYNTSLEISKDKLKIDHENILGTGEFGCVFKGVIVGKVEEVAVKVAKQVCSSTLKGLLSEIKILSVLGKHENVVALVGAYTAELGHGVVYVATEFCSLGSLQNYLRKYPMTALGLKGQETQQNGSAGMVMYENTSFTISFLNMLQWSHQIACGMEYLESKHVVHADLATRNVLLNSEKVAKVSDFGLSRRMYNYMNYVKTHQEPLPWRWMSIESLKRMEFSSKSDVWSFGITLWEIYSKGDIPYQGLSWTQGFSNDLTNGLRPQRPSLAPIEMFKLIQDCWSCKPEHRPSFSDLLSSTTGMLLKFSHQQDGKTNSTMYANV